RRLQVCTQVQAPDSSCDELRNGYNDVIDHNNINGFGYEIQLNACVIVCVGDCELRVYTQVQARALSCDELRNGYNDVIDNDDNSNASNNNINNNSNDSNNDFGYEIQLNACVIVCFEGCDYFAAYDVEIEVNGTSNWLSGEERSRLEAVQRDWRLSRPAKPYSVCCLH
ncbi:unnamed protein product, partial [Thelazia callipaeda]|uniref:PITH domain-containing protein n=1 Tax=Thelazia callipaeda TaxID=103827 RepID=A0A0N5CTI0_THECL